MLPKNRMALICQHCRLVNGQAPPGVNRVQDVGKWRCGGCRGWNGEEDEGTKIVQQMKEKARLDKRGQLSSSNSEEEKFSSSDADFENVDADVGSEEGAIQVQEEASAGSKGLRKRGRPKGTAGKK
jgi:hypothetical protein